jgi:crossover junction endodeoxyribonuclease RuvC
VDPGLNCTGYGVVDHGAGAPRFLEGGVVRTSASATLEVRLSVLWRGIQSVVAEYRPDVLVVERVHSKYDHPQTAILMGHARGVILLAAAEAGLEVASYPASLVKRSLTGHGRASKEQVAAMVIRALNLAQTPEPADVTDALALCLCHAAPARELRQTGGGLAPAVARALAEHERSRKGD